MKTQNRMKYDSKHCISHEVIREGAFNNGNAILRQVPRNSHVGS